MRLMEWASNCEAPDGQDSPAGVLQRYRPGFTGGEDHLSREGELSGRERHRWQHPNAVQRSRLWAVKSTVRDGHGGSPTPGTPRREGHADSATRIRRQRSTASIGL